MKTFNIEVRHIEVTTFTVGAERWQDALEEVSELADDAGLDTIGGFRIFDENHRPIDTLG
jgi:hypothetical protein